MGEGAVAVRLDDFGNHDVVATIPALVFAFRFDVLRVSREFAQRLERVPVIGCICAASVRRPPRLGAQIARRRARGRIDQRVQFVKPRVVGARFEDEGSAVHGVCRKIDPDVQKAHLTWRA